MLVSLSGVHPLHCVLAGLGTNCKTTQNQVQVVIPIHPATEEMLWLALAQQPYKAGRRVWHSVGGEAMAMIIGHGGRTEGSSGQGGVLPVGEM